MRVRPVFWFLLLLTGMSIVLFAFVYRANLPLQFDVTRQSLGSSQMTTLELYLTDTQGKPVDQAQISPSAHMTNMEMVTYETAVYPQGNGLYQVHLDLYMAGPWAITISAHAPGFSPSIQTMFVDVD